MCKKEFEMNRRILCCIALMLALCVEQSVSAPREASKNDAALMKLQATLKAITAERDAAKTDLAKLNGEIEQLRKDKSAAEAVKDDLNGSLAAQRNSNQALQGRLQNTEARLSESSEKAKELAQAKADLAQELSSLKAKQQATEQQLLLCGQHNAQLIKSADELLEKYQSKGTFASLMQDEPLLQFQSVEMEGIVEQYRDNIQAGKYQAAE